jgi:hypothetical protein
MVDTDTTNEYETSRVDILTISKAKKKEGFYVCPVKGVFNIVFPRSSIISIKETSNSLIIKSKDKSMTRYMDDLNDKILTIVKESSSFWFNTRIDDDLIDEYYISTLQYDKRQGETIRLKIKNLDEIEEAKDFDSASDVKIVVTFKGLKFFKQKFYPEFQIDLVEVLEREIGDPMFNDEDHLDELFVDEDEHPLPSFEEVMAMKDECLKSLKSSCDELAEKLRDVELLYQQQFDKLTTLSSCEKMNEIIELCEDYRKTYDCE